MSDKILPVDRLSALLGFDPLKPGKLAADVFQDVVAELHKERTDKAKLAARDLFKKAIELREVRDASVREFRKQTEKFDKELGAVLKKIEQMIEDGSASAETEPDARSDGDA